MLKLSYEDYEKNKSLFKEEYLVWDSLKKEFIKDDSKKVVVEIKELEKLSEKEKNNLKITLDNWKKEIQYIDMKKYNDYGSVLSSSKLYKNIAEEIETYLFKFKSLVLFYHEEDNYFCCYIKHDDLYVAIGIFSIEKGEHNRCAKLEYSLVFPESQRVRKERKNGTVGACGHNLRVSMINSIFSNKKIKHISSEPINKIAIEALKKLKFK